MSPLANVAEQWQSMLCKHAPGMLYMVVLGRMHLDVPSCRSVVAKEMLRRQSHSAANESTPSAIRLDYVWSQI